MSLQTRALISVVAALFFLAGAFAYATKGYSHEFHIWTQWVLATSSAAAWASSAIFSMEISSGAIAPARLVVYSNSSILANFWAALLTGLLAMIVLFS